ncbi:hypothetical protein HAX54_036764, partial [Datura stramonium]|nr:hypothetical protein [Datura stramonium]
DTQKEWDVFGLVPPEKREGRPLLKLRSPLDIRKESPVLIDDDRMEDSEDQTLVDDSE